MLPLRIPSVFSASIFLLSVSYLGTSQQSAPTIKYTASLGGGAKCLSEVNAARGAAGLKNFAEATNDKKLSAPSDDLENDTEWKKVCEHLIPTQKEPVEATSGTNPFEKGTYAFKSLTTAEPNCKEIVNYWKAAFKNFTGLPPSESQAGDLYKSYNNVSFVALYNTSSNATADCQVVTCTKTTTPGDSSIRDSPSGSQEYGYAMICKTMPAAFADKNSAPFTQDQWDRIISSLTGSASAAIPGFGAFFIVVLSMAVL
ncbi:SAG family member (sag6) [Eimeria tenella]|uniref:SAG family member (Sag6) n=1 Tax=Eimeria tenella TaxID=5802 RepID=Q70CD8_EIMTE|nr:SAG family member (sag6) [Eimeria tenella]AET50584.1 hypothetical protein [Eimeria tenella]CAE52297.1 surface antigen 6 [Eimeria tenella]CDJ40603.1 SAG family member (sag6) [Eimeria tenella]|eukprot:XP_013231353.1 SAG family member (sag6) [Eimeria tenella]